MSLFQSLRSPIADLALNRRTAILASLYALIVCFCLYLAFEIRFDFIVPEQHQADRVRLLPVAVAIKLLALVMARQLGSLMTYFSIPDLLKLGWAMVGSSGVLFLLRLTELPNLSAPRGVLLVDFMLCLGALCVGRLGTRLYRERISGTKRNGTGVQQQQQRIAIIGAGDVGASLAKEFLTSPSRGFRPVMFFDDDPDKRGKLVHGIPVLGRPETIAEAKEVGTLAKAVLAMPSASAKRVREIVALFTQQGLKVETLPSLEELASGRVRASRIRPVEVQDLLGRDAVNLDAAGIRHVIESRVVMVTGAGGSIGSELCRQIAALNPKRLLMVEQAEGSLFNIEQEMNELGFGGGLAVPLVADILDYARMDYIFARYQPEVVFHAAAHKHVFLMERQPAEAIRNNAFGTRQLATIAASHGCAGFVLISTDKAINPTSVMGATKRLAELFLQSFQRFGGNGTKYMAVRFGNVLGSSGSVIPTFKRQIAAGGPVTVTHPCIPVDGRLLACAFH